MEGQSDTIATVVQTVEVDNVEPLGLVVLRNQIVMPEYHVVVELLADHPYWQNRVLQVLPDFDVL